MCKRWVGDWTKTATYWTPALLAIAAPLSHHAGLPCGPSSLLGLVLTASNCNNWLQTLISWSLELPVTPGYIIVWQPPASVSVASALNSARPHLNSIQPVDRMQLLFTLVHFLFDCSAGSEVNMLHRFRLLYSKVESVEHCLRGKKRHDTVPFFQIFETACCTAWHSMENHQY